MVINYLGGGSFKIQSGENSILVDPESNRFKADVVLRTLVSADILKNSGEETVPNEIVFPGEYEVGGIEIIGIPIVEESSDKFVKTAYLVRWEGVKLAFLGHLSTMLSGDIVEKLDEPEILFLPVGGGHFLNPEVAARLAKQVEPAFIIPTFYKNPADFLKNMGQKTPVQEKLVFKKKDLESEKNKVVVLSADH